MGQMLAIETIGPREASEAVAAALLGWRGVTSEPGPIEASLAFRFRRQVLGRVFAACGLHAAVDAQFPPAMGEVLIALGRAERHPVIPDAGWVLRTIHRRSDIAEAIALLRDNYDRVSSRLRLV